MKRDQKWTQTWWPPLPNSPVTKDLTKPRSSIGLVNQFNNKNPDLKHAMVYWQGLLKKSSKFFMGRGTRSGTEESKRIINHPATLIKNYQLGTDRRFEERGRFLPHTNGGPQKDTVTHHGRLTIPKPSREKLCNRRARTTCHPMGSSKMPTLHSWHQIYSCNRPPATTGQARRPWVCRVCHGTPSFWQIS